MGSQQDVIAALDRVFPRTAWEAPMSMDGGLSFREGFWTLGDLLFEFFVTDDTPVRVLEFGVRGSGDPMPHLARLRKATGWWILDAGNEEWLDESGSGWTNFQSYLGHINGGD